MMRYRMLATQQASQKLAGLNVLAPDLLSLISDERTLYTAWEHLANNGGDAPGPDGCRYDDFTPSEIWRWCRGERDSIRSGEYFAGEESVHKIAKGTGRGFRELVLQSIFDRVVHRGVVEVMQPLVDPLFDARSFGYRPKKGPLRALAVAERLYGSGKRGAWVSVDIRNAFPSVPIGRLLGVLRHYFPDDDLLAFFAILTQPGMTTGLRQGSPLSPLLLNLYLHHLLDQKWRGLYPQIPLLRFADDILLLCRTQQEASDAYADLSKLVRNAGFELKEGREKAITNLVTGRKMKWMGFGIGMAKGGLSYTVTDEAWDKLEEGLASAHAKPNSPIAANLTIKGWIADKGPCFPHSNLGAACNRIERLAANQGFEEVPTREKLIGLWQRAHARWCKLRRKGTGV